MFCSTMRDACQSIGVQVEEPRKIPIRDRDRDFKSWENIAKDVVKPGVQAIVFILQGRKNAAPLYKQLKKLFIEQIPCSTQVVLADTISRGKNLRSIVTKIAIQIQAKLGGTPWAI